MFIISCRIIRLGVQAVFIISCRIIRLGVQAEFIISCRIIRLGVQAALDDSSLAVAVYNNSELVTLNEKPRMQ